MIEGITKLLLSMLGILGVVGVSIGILMGLFIIIYIIKHFNDMED